MSRSWWATVPASLPPFDGARHLWLVTLALPVTDPADVTTTGRPVAVDGPVCGYCGVPWPSLAGGYDCPGPPDGGG